MGTVAIFKFSSFGLIVRSKSSNAGTKKKKQSGFAVHTVPLKKGLLQGKILLFSLICTNNFDVIIIFMCLTNVCDLCVVFNKEGIVFFIRLGVLRLRAQR